jgi:hypothetical protein
MYLVYLVSFFPKQNTVRRGKFVPVLNQLFRESLRNEDVKHHHTWARLLMEASGHLSASAATSPKKEQEAPIGSESEWDTEPVWMAWSRETIL